MKILLIHFEDDPLAGPWTEFAWDRVVDLGLGGKGSYERWKQKFRCPVASLNLTRQGFDDFRRVRDVLGLGCGCLVDEYGLDWWEILSLLLHAEMETLIVLQHFAMTLSPDDEVHVSRPGLHAGLLQCLLGSRAKVFPARPATERRGLRHYLRVFKKLSAMQLIDVVGDKYDVGYQFRGRFSRRRNPSAHPVVLLPSAYVNVSRTCIAYANTFPQEKFLLVATRNSGWLRNPPGNVASAWLSSYASLRDRSKEYSHLENKWRVLRNELQAAPEFHTLNRLGFLDRFHRQLQHGLEVRDAWLNVFEREPVEGVLCADDSNPYTRIPMLLAQERGLPNIACHHGALDGRYVFKRAYGDVIWAKGKMEQDYLVRRCGVPAERVEICAPAPAAGIHEREDRNRRIFRPAILLISEAFDVSGGRAKEFYKDTVPPLANLALSTGRKLMVKLHPVESKPERAAMLDRILSSHQKSVTHLISGPLTEELLGTAWFGITVISTVASECAIRGIPCFFCRWLESWPYEYVEQFIRFGVGIGLDDPSEIATIPQLLEHHAIGADVAGNCWQPAASNRLRQLLDSTQKPYFASAG